MSSCFEISHDKTGHRLLRIGIILNVFVEDLTRVCTQPFHEQHGKEDTFKWLFIVSHHPQHQVRQSKDVLTVSV